LHIVGFNGGIELRLANAKSVMTSLTVCHLDFHVLFIKLSKPLAFVRDNNLTKTSIQKLGNTRDDFP
jgi:hypothetical protein